MIRQAEEKDIPAITGIYNGYILQTTICFAEEPVPEEEMLRQMRWILSLGCPYLVWEEEGKVMGFCYAHPWKEKSAYRKTLETTVYVAPEAVKHGIGMRLMQRLISESREQGFHALIACITEGNLPSTRMHERLGFGRKSAFEEVGMKFGRWLGVVDYELILDRESHIKAIR